MGAIDTAARQNATIAAMLARVADLLEAEDANPFRVRSYRRASARIAQLQEDVHTIHRERGHEGLRAIEGVGEGLAHAIGEIVESGRLGLLDRLEAEVAPERLLQRVPGVGAKLAHRIHDELGITGDDAGIVRRDNNVMQVSSDNIKRVTRTTDSTVGTGDGVVSPSFSDGYISSPDTSSEVTGLRWSNST